MVAIVPWNAVVFLMILVVVGSVIAFLVPVDE